MSLWLLISCDEDVTIISGMPAITSKARALTEAPNEWIARRNVSHMYPGPPEVWLNPAESTCIEFGHDSDCVVLVCPTFQVGIDEKT